MKTSTQLKALIRNLSKKSNMEAEILLRNFFADFLYVLSDGMETSLDYPDAASISSYAKDAALYCQTTGIIGGRTGGVFAPQETATRAEVATIIQRFIEAVMK